MDENGQPKGDEKKEKKKDNNDSVSTAESDKAIDLAGGPGGFLDNE